MTLTPGQVDRINQLSDQWSFLWDKRRSLWIAAEDCPDGEQVENADLDVLLARLLYCDRRGGHSGGMTAPGSGQTRSR